MKQSSSQLHITESLFITHKTSYEKNPPFSPKVSNIQISVSLAVIASRIIIFFLISRFFFFFLIIEICFRLLKRTKGTKEVIQLKNWATSDKLKVKVKTSDLSLEPSNKYT